jgi:pimeloyl-ACP methyl ester carboxylesterase
MLKKLLLIHDNEEEKKLKLKIMSKSGIPVHAIEYRNIMINNDKDEYIHTMIIDDNAYENKRNLVLIHGLTGSCVCYYGILSELRRNFRIIAIDIPGMGW